ncbi:MAG: HAD family hydrolase [Oscillibacter sp.]|jgi:HAD superfamily hydrolase (TIGR01549 family)|nr:HAD family hydrolase [Oscillibacter sp.]
MISAILWDYDGTLIDSAAKNRAVTMEVLRRVDPALLSPLPTALVSVDSYRAISRRYRNWTELYADNYRMSPEQTALATPLWAPCQQADQTPSPLFAGVRELLRELEHVPMGICSQNAGDTMRRALRAEDAEQYFGAVTGFDTVGMYRQKPKPDTFLKCLELLKLPPEGTFVYVGDQADDVRFARGAEQELKRTHPSTSVICIAALWSDAETPSWPMQPDLSVQTPEELGTVLRQLLEKGD